MVAKISTGGNMFGALAYNQNKVDSEEAKVLFSNRMLLSEDGNFSIGECMHSFEMQMPVQLSTKKPILHIRCMDLQQVVVTSRYIVAFCDLRNFLYDSCELCRNLFVQSPQLDTAKDHEALV